MANELVRTSAGRATLIDPPISPTAVAVLHGTPNATFAAEEVFKASISNEHTRRAYGQIVGRFLVWCDERGVALHQITPGLTTNAAFRSAIWMFRSYSLLPASAKETRFRK